MIQSLRADRLAQLPPDAFDVVVVDEFHHAAAPTYDALLNRVEPRELLGLTATPGATGRQGRYDLVRWPNRRGAPPLGGHRPRVPQFPFQYFGVADGTDLRSVDWRRGGYVLQELSSLYSGDDRRVTKLLEALNRIVLGSDQDACPRFLRVG